MKKKAKANAKAKGKSKRTPRKAATTTTTTTTTTTSSSSTSSSTDKQPVDLAEVRKNITNIVGANATALTQAVVDVGLTGQLVPVKYLFEVSGLYPASESSQAKPDQESLAHVLMRGLRLPESPVVNEDDEDVVASTTSSAIPEAVTKESVKQAGDADSGTDADGKHSPEEQGGPGERTGTMP
jgi:hypothetical protein